MLHRVCSIAVFGWVMSSRCPLLAIVNISSKNDGSKKNKERGQSDLSPPEDLPHGGAEGMMTTIACSTDDAISLLSGQKQMTVKRDWATRENRH